MRFKLFCKTPFLAFLIAVALFLGTIYSLPSISEFCFNTFVAKPGTVAAMGINPHPYTFQGLLLQKKALEDPRILPLYGSSEMSMIYDYHPSKVLTPETGVTPLLVGKGGTQTIIQMLNIAALGNDISGKKFAIFVTPQWYGVSGINEDTFAGNFSALHVYTILKDRTLSPSLKNNIAGRLLQFTKAYQDYPYLKKMLVLQGQSDWNSRITRLFYAVPAQMEYAAVVLQDLRHTIYRISLLPADTIASYANVPSTSATEPQWDQMRLKAIELAKLKSNNNPFEMDNDYFTTNILPNLQKRKEADKDTQYTSSQEYGDLQLLMEVLKEEGAQPLFVILPMNGRWVDFTGIRAEKRQACYQKLAQMIQAEGFALADFSSHEYDDYYLRDPWHPSWEGWVDIDKALYQYYFSS
ncbi:D-alanyl-lipoteichoic acid biosynthesis protein DltD [Desulfitobacterium sp.]|uniref:D-alanyl-lipoteichoic acid biosynthesis protein DltD n=1 Tax=Desulfitobacterium sp. TaxID=49981 RepID=UPI002B20CA6E|nr:D-alanyl-lipoteichoic acid biosynthesis protein DltD [Desulfitobacterium sp.]MEA4901440.1 D-alanyl-lipoteichoic acid biosynthesis protein DltD [Desulfitobacterium sp.]